jgi:hypothetical protein
LYFRPVIRRIATRSLRFARAFSASLVDSPLRFARIDYAQGTMTFWAEALKLPDVGETDLIDVGGIRITTDETGYISVYFPGIDGPSHTADEPVQWALGTDVFIALRWDSRRPVTGTQGFNYRVMLRVDEERSGNVNAPFMPDPSPQPEIIVGDAGGFFNVEQLVVYGRPLIVANSEGGEDPFAVMSEEKTGSAQLVAGGQDVSFATSSPIHAGCENYDALAWTMPIDNLLEGDLRSGGSTIPWQGLPPITVPDLLVPADELVYSSAVAVGSVQSGLASEFVLPLKAGRSYSYSALAHAMDGGAPGIEIFLYPNQTEGSKISSVSRFNTDVQAPGILTGTFEMPDNVAPVLIRLAQMESQSTDLAVFHSLVIRENMYSNPSFEEDTDDEPAGEIFQGWEVRQDNEVAYRGSEEFDFANSGLSSACFRGKGSRADIHQGLDSTKLNNEKFYVAGAATHRGFPQVGKNPGITTGNSGFFGTGQPSELNRRGRVESSLDASPYGKWDHLAVVTYRLYGPEFDTSNEQINFGGLVSQPDDEVDLCIDDLYFHEVERIDGEFPAQ